MKNKIIKISVEMEFKFKVKKILLRIIQSVDCALR